MKECQGKALVALVADDARILAVCRAAFQLGIHNVVALVNEPARIGPYHTLRIKTFTPSLFQPTLLALFARSPELFEQLTQTASGQDVREIYLHNSEVTGKALQELGLRGDLLVLSIGRNGK